MGINVKRTDAQIFVFGHKEYDFKNNALFTPLQVNAEKNGTDICELKDNQGDNISLWNDTYCEVTGTYFIWKNISDDIRLKYIGETTYRRIFTIDEFLDFDDVFKNYDIILPKKFFINDNMTNEELYATYHNVQDLYDVGMVIGKKYPEYSESFNKMFGNNYLYNANGFIMKNCDFKEYCKFLFDILDGWKEMHNINTMEDIYSYTYENVKNGKYRFFRENDIGNGVNYQKRVLGFLAERILNVYIIQHFKNIFEIPYDFLENTDY